MRALRTLAAVAVASVVLSGCVVSINDGEVDVNHHDWKQKQLENREAISSLRVGASLNYVKDRLGNPDDSEGYTKDSQQIVVLYYRTRHAHDDGKTTRDETTPVVFVDDSLVGWGDKVLSRYAP